jgi:hypothetical protein
MLKQVGSIALAVFMAGLATGAQAQGAAHRGLAFSLGVAGAARPQPDVVSIAAPLANLTSDAATDVIVESVTLGGAADADTLPLRVGLIGRRSSAIVEARFAGGPLIAGHSYPLVMTGTYRDDDRSASQHALLSRFLVRTEIVIPPLAKGSGRLRTVTAPAHRVEGGKYPHQAPKMDNEVNSGAPPVPTNPEVAGVPTPTGTGTQPVVIGDPPAIRFDVNNPVGFSGAGIGCSGDSAAACAEPSGASGNGMLFISANWRDAYSTTGGGGFTILDPTTIFPADAVGFCCDQIVQYAPSIDRFIWLLQGTGYRLAMASPAQIKSSHGTAWTYWNLSPSLFGKCAAPDYPDLSIGDNSLYISWDAGGGTGCTAGFQVVRTSLAGIKAGGTISLDFTDPANAPRSTVWGEHLTQNTGNEIFWAGHNGNTKLTVYSMLEGSSSYVWRDVGISSWAANAPTSTTPDKQDWLAKNFNGPGGNSFPRNGVIGAARAGDQLWFGWTAGTDSNFKQAHIEIVTLDRANNFNKTQQVQVWNDGYAYGYPAFTTNACTGELGMSFETGGGGNYENHVVGFWGDFVAYVTSNSNVGTDRFADYVTIRRAPPTKDDNGNLFEAFGFGVDKKAAPATGNTTDVRFVKFGRPNSKRLG